MTLTGKNILFIAPTFLGYEKTIMRYLQKMGANVDYYDERPGNSFFSKALIRINRNLLSYKIKKYYASILKEVDGKTYDYILVVNLESMFPSILLEIKKKFPTARTILYMWDSITNKKNAQKSLPYFDKILSFDKNDVQKYNFQFRPLFYDEEYAKIGRENKNFNYDVLFIGTVHSDRYAFLQAVKKQLHDLGLKTFFYFFFPSKFLYYKKKIIDKSFRHAKKSEFHFTPLSQKEVFNLVAQSRSIIDIQHPNQTGLTMRTIECIGVKRKLLTTNKSIKEYDFYNSNNILQLDREKPVVSSDFFTIPYREIDLTIYNTYSIKSWIIDILSE